MNNNLRIKITIDSKKKLKSIVSVLTGKQAVNQKLNINVNVYYDVLIIEEWEGYHSHWLAID